MTKTYPRLRVARVADAPESASLFVVQIKPFKGSRWMIMTKDSNPMFFDNRQEANSFRCYAKKMELVPVQS